MTGTECTVRSAGGIRPGDRVRISKAYAERLCHLARCSPDYVARFRAPMTVAEIWQSKRYGWTSVTVRHDNGSTDGFAPEDLERIPDGFDLTEAGREAFRLADEAVES